VSIGDEIYVNGGSVLPHKSIKANVDGQSYPTTQLNHILTYMQFLRSSCKRSPHGHAPSFTTTVLRRSLFHLSVHIFVHFYTVFLSELGAYSTLLFLRACKVRVSQLHGRSGHRKCVRRLQGRTCAIKRVALKREGTYTVLLYGVWLGSKSLQ